MSTISTVDPNLALGVTGKLRQLRHKLLGWLLVRGVGQWLAALLAVLAADMALDRFFRMDFAQRLILLVVITLFAIGYFLWRVIWPLFSRPSDQMLIYEIESQHPELNENLISSWQLSKEPDLASYGVSPELAAATVRSGFQKAEQLDFSSSLDRGHFLQNLALLLAGLLISAGLVVGVTQTDFLQTWFNRNLLLLDDQWPQATYLEIAGVKDGRLTLPRGTEHRQIVAITETSQIQNVPVTIEIDGPGGRASHTMKSTGKLDGREKMFMFHNVSSTFRFRALGGDAITEWVDVDLVEPPVVIDFQLTAKLPEYTGVAKVEYKGSGPHSILVGSGLQVLMTANKPLGQVSVKRGDEVFKLQPAGEANQYSFDIPADQVRGGEYQFELVDQSGLRNYRASKFNLTIKEDRPPKVRANLQGISGLVVPRAMIPTSFHAVDEYGLSKLYFDALWKSGSNDSPVANRQLVINKYPTTEPARREVKEQSVLDLIPLNLKPGMSFRFSVAAEDRCPPEPGKGRSQEFLLRVVSDEELRSDLLRREIEQRKAFEQAYEVQLELSTEVEVFSVQLPNPGETDQEFQARRDADLIGLLRNQKGIGTAVARVADRFEEFLAEVKNNRLDEAEQEIAPGATIEARFNLGIIQPIRALDEQLIAQASRQLGACRQVSGDNRQLLEIVDQTLAAQQLVLIEMKRILQAMNESEDFQEVINDLLEIKIDSESIKDGIQKKINPDDIFDEKIFE